MASPYPLPPDPPRQPRDERRWVDPAWRSRWLPVWIAAVILILLAFIASALYFGLFQNSLSHHSHSRRPAATRTLEHPAYGANALVVWRRAPEQRGSGMFTVESGPAPVPQGQQRREEAQENT